MGKSSHALKYISLKKNKTDKEFEVYKLFIQARDFHYDQMNKWSSHFYLVSAAVFIAYYNFVGEGTSNKIKIIISAIGFVVSILWHLSVKGYSYWNVHYIDQLHKYERKIIRNVEDRVYSEFKNQEKNNNYFSPISGANVSTTRIAALLGFLVALGWSTVFWLEIFKSTNGTFENLITFLLHLTYTLVSISIVFAYILPSIMIVWTIPIIIIIYTFPISVSFLLSFASTMLISGLLGRKLKSDMSPFN